MKKIKGFTLVEVLLSAAVISILVLASFSVLEVGQGAWFSGDVHAELRKEIIRAFMAMERELSPTRPAQQSVPFGESRTAITFKIPQDSNDADTTILDSFGYIEWSGNISYALDGSNQIIRTDPAGATQVLARYMTSLQFSRFRNNPALPQDLLIINLTAQKTSSVGKVASETGQLIIRMRN